MIIAIASGKGGTGKTTISSGLVATWPKPVVAVDLDVEEPNLHLFLHPEQDNVETVHLDVPVVDEARCTRCRACVELCQFKAIVILGDTPMVFAEMCHGCGGCFRVCPEGALSVGTRELGVIEYGHAGDITCLTGRLRIGEAMSPPLMRVVKERLTAVSRENQADVIIDAPPGVSCPAVAAVRDADAVVLVTEPTPFGAYDFSLALDAFLPLGKPLFAVINRAGLGDDEVYGICRERNVPILAEIENSRVVAEAYARGEIVSLAKTQLAPVFEQIRTGLIQAVSEKEPVHA
ncbi:4Fe-4S binding protein [Desulfovibrio inopinatus]|uniref:4Fe-4S binding protein n=1 Tax=Desulfovibrio inopinatus TaxID=102109 RepID=UPI0003F7BB61|nr:ATP-binding protein [Desulfovibrio inopinatus]